jgi:hypothetical protein
MIGYHCTSENKLKRYEATSCIISPVRFWIYESSARNWLKKTGRTIILRINVDIAYPLPDHKPNGHAWYTPENVREWEILI